MHARSWPSILSAHACRFVLDGVQRMRERPIQDLVDGLVQLGVDAKCTMGTGCPPVEVNSQGLPTGKVRGYADHSGSGSGSLYAYVCVRPSQHAQLDPPSWCMPVHADGRGLHTCKHMLTLTF